MALLEFDLAEVRQLCEHAIAAKERHLNYITTLAPEDAPEAQPGLILVGDHGVYLMSNGKPGLTKEDGKRHVVAYAKGINPTVDDFDTWWEAKRATYGGDDGADDVPWAEAILEMIGANPNATTLQIEISEDGLELKGLV
jgi:hypothetical protein